MASPDLVSLRKAVLEKLGIQPMNSGASYGPWIEEPAGETLTSMDPAERTPIAQVRMAAEEDYDEVVHAALQAFVRWRMVPAPLRGLLVREIGEELRAVKQELGALVSMETGKILQEGIGEVQEMIDIADFAVGLSRQLYGLTMHSERPMHRMYEQWHPLGVVGVITRLQFSGRGVVMECADRGCVRRLRRVEAVARDSADGDRRAENLLPRAGAQRVRGRI